MPSKVGRPKKHGTKDERITIRLTTNERKRLNYICEETGRSASDIFREMFEIKFDNLLNEEFLADKK